MATEAQIIKENIMGYKPIPKLLFSLAIPAVIANVVNSLYNIVDQIFIGRGVGYLGNAATSIAFPLTTICLAIGLMTGIGAAANFNLELGKKNPEKAKKVAGSASGSLIIFGIILAIIVRIFLEPLMILFGASDQILAYSMTYTGITSLGIPFLLFSIGINPLVRSDGSSTYSMFAIVAGAILNVILDPIFIFILDMGIAGAAWATVISEILSALILAMYFPRFKTVKFEAKDFIPRFNAIKIVFSLGFPSFTFQFSNMIIQVVSNNLFKTYGAISIYGSDIPIAVSGIVTKINIIFTSVIIGIVQGSQPIFGYNYGAKKFSRVRETARLLLKTASIISFISFCAFQIFPKQIIMIFGDGDELYFKFAIRFMRIFLFTVFLNGIQISISTFFPAIGKAKEGALLALSKQIFILLPLMLILPNFFGLDGVIFATPISDILTFILAVIFMTIEMKKMPHEDYDKIED